MDASQDTINGLSGVSLKCDYFIPKMPTPDIYFVDFTHAVNVLTLETYRNASSRRLLDNYLRVARTRCDIGR